MENEDQESLKLNPYIDYDLLNQQNEQFSPLKNKRFEYKHTVSLQSLPTKLQKSRKNDDSLSNNESDKSKVKYLTFEWNKDFGDKYECDTKHMLYLIYLSLIKCEQRQIHKNEYYRNCKREERILPLLDKERVMTNLIDFFLKNIEKNKINGVLLKTLKCKEFINNILSKNGECTLGWSTKIYAKLCDEINCREINGFVSIPNYKYKSIK